MIHCLIIPVITEPLSLLKATFANMSPEELKKRQEYLREQREKLTAMKQKVSW